MWALSLVRSSASVTAAAPELVMSNSTAPAGTLAGLGSQPCDVIWILTVLDLSPAAAAVPVDPLAPEPEPELAHPAATRARLAASTAAAAPRRLARIPLLRTIKNSSRLTDRKERTGRGERPATAGRAARWREQGWMWPAAASSAGRPRARPPAPASAPGRRATR